jgi:CHASE1-domain containing sensor protein
MVLAIAIVVGAFAFNQTRIMVEQDITKTLDGHTEHLREALVLRLQAYDDLARGFRGLYFSGPILDTVSFTRYAESLDVANHLPSVHSISFARRVPHAETSQFLESVRRREHPGTTETHEFFIFPAGERPEYWVIEQVWPRRAGDMLGFDLRADETRREAVERARDTGRPTASGPLRIVGDRMEKPGYALRFPIYAGGIAHATIEERRKHFQGVLSATFWTEDLGREIIAESWATQLRLWLYDMGYRDEPEQPVLLFDSHPTTMQRRLPTRARRRSIR